MNKSKQKGSIEIVISVILIIVIMVIFRFTRSELYDEKNDFQENKVVNNQVDARIEYLKWYDTDDITNYYVFTEFGKLHIDAKDYGFWNGNEKMYDDLEDYVGQKCTFTVEDSWFKGKQAIRFKNCHFE